MRKYIKAPNIIRAQLSLRGLLFFLFYFILSLSVFAQAPSIQWQKCLGGSGKDTATCVKQTTDGGYIIAGYTYSNDGNVSGNHGGVDVWIVKLSNNGTIDWQKTYGGTGDDEANAIQQTKDGGYIVAGWTSSNNGDITLNKGYMDVWVIKLDSVGVIEWQHTWGGSAYEEAYAIQQTKDSGYIVAGYTNSSDGDIISRHPQSEDFWILKLTNSGGLSWAKCYGGTSDEEAYAIQQSHDGGYIVAGWTSSYNGDVSGYHGVIDYWVLKLDDTGAISWQKALGGSNQELAYSVQQVADGGYIVAGYTTSDDEDVTGHHGFAGHSDVWIVKLDSMSNITWKKCYGGTDGDNAMSIQQAVDGSYILAGGTVSNDGDVSGCHVNMFGQRLDDFWIVKISDTGAINWAKCYGGTGDEIAYSIQQTTDGGYIAAGYTNSNDSDVSGNHGLSDFWVVKLNMNTGVLSSDLNRELKIWPNPSNGSFTISGNIDNSKQATIEILNTIGQPVYKNVAAIQNNHLQEEIRLYAPTGIYIVRIRTDEGNSVIRVVVE